MANQWRRIACGTLVVLLVPIGLNRLPAAEACSCVADGYDQDVADADVVFDGVAVQQLSAGWRFDVSGVVKGAASDPQDVVTGSPANTCSTRFENGRAYRVFARREGPVLTTNICSGNSLLSGYRLAAADGGVFTFGASSFHGSAARLPLAAPIVGMAATPSGRGYWLAAADGGVFTYGDARFFGSAGGVRLHARIVGITASPSGGGYRLVAADGGVFTYGDARFAGSAAGARLDRPVTGIASTGSGNGYWLLGGDGGVFAYGDAGYFGRVAFSAGLSAQAGGRAATSASAVPQPAVATGIAASHRGTGYWILDTYGTAGGFGDVGSFPRQLSPETGGFYVGITRTGGEPGLVAATSHGVVAGYTGAQLGDITGHRLHAPVVATSA